MMTQGWLVAGLGMGLSLLPALGLWRRARPRWALAAGLLILALAAALLLMQALGLRLTENRSGSLDGRLFLHRMGGAFGRGDLVAMRWRGDAHYPAGAVFIKRVVGLPGDRVTRQGQAVWVEAQAIGLAKASSRQGHPLHAIAPGVVPAGHYFLATPHADSFDSRYREVGLIQASDILGRAYVLF